MGNSMLTWENQLKKIVLDKTGKVYSKESFCLEIEPFIGQIHNSIIKKIHDELPEVDSDLFEKVKGFKSLPIASTNRKIRKYLKSAFDKMHISNIDYYIVFGCISESTWDKKLGTGIPINSNYYKVFCDFLEYINANKAFDTIDYKKLGSSLDYHITEISDKIIDHSAIFADEYLSIRKDKYEELVEKLNVYRRLVIQGVSGIGKSTFVKLFINKSNKESLGNLIWLDCKNLQTELISIFGNDTSITRFRNYLERITENTLIVFDALDDKSYFQDFTSCLPKKENPNVRIIITSIFPASNKIFKDNDIHPIKLKSLDKDDSVELLSHYCNKPIVDSKEREIAIKLSSSFLLGFPLAIKLCGLYIKNTKINIESFLELYSNDVLFILDKQADDENEKSISRIWEIYLDKLQCFAEPIRILKICSLLQKSKIPTSFISDLYNNNNSLHDYLKLLRSYGLIDIFEFNNTHVDIIMHSLFQHVVLRRLSKNERDDFVATILNETHNKFRKNIFKNYVEFIFYMKLAGLMLSKYNKLRLLLNLKVLILVLSNNIRFLNEMVILRIMSAGLTKSAKDGNVSSIFIKRKFSRRFVKKVCKAFHLDKNQLLKELNIFNDNDLQILNSQYSTFNLNDNIKEGWLEMLPLIEKKAMENNSIIYHFLCGGILKINGKYKRAVEHFQKGADLGHKLSQFLTGEIYLLDKNDLPKDYSKALFYLTKSIEGPDAFQKSYVYLGIMYLDGLGMDDVNPQKGVEYLTIAANKKSGHAYYKLGEIYRGNKFNHYGIFQNLALAKKMYRKALRLGIKEAKKELNELKNVK